jgi:acyl carrier protein
MEQKLRQIIATIAEIAPDFPGTADLKEDLQVDSHRAVEMVFEIERTFNIRIPDDRFGEMKTFDGTLSLVKSLADAAAVAAR